MRSRFRILSITGLVAGLMLAMVHPASATIHETVASFCASTYDTSSPTTHLHDPPGLTPSYLGGTSNADNIAQPLFASGIYEWETAEVGQTYLDVQAEAPASFSGGEDLITINEDAPNLKLDPGAFGPLGAFIEVELDGETVYLQIALPTTDSHESLANCANFEPLF